MPHLEVRTPDGRTELRRLSRRNPIIVGRNPVSDIHVDDESVGAIHCRVIWNGAAFEVAAVSGEGVEVNGTLVRKKKLATGDVIRVGEIDLVMLNGSGEVKRAPSAVAAGKAPPPTSEEETLAASELSDDDWEELSEGDAEIPMDTDEAEPPPAVRDRPAAPPKALAKLPAVAPAEEPVLLDETPAAAPAAAPRPKETPAKSAKRWGGVVKTKRPGEQDILTSPLVLGFGGLALALLLAAGAIWLLIGREGADRLYTSAVSDRDAGRYAQAIGGFEQFLLEYPTDKRALEAKFALGMTRIERYAGGSAPDFEKALGEFDAFVRENRDASDFDSQKEPLRKLAQQIASAATSAAIRTGDRGYLAPATAARTLFERYAPTDRSLDEVKAALAKEFAAAEAAVRKREYFDVAATKIETAIAKNDFETAFQTRSDLLTRYPDLQNDRRVRTLLNNSLEAEKKLVHPQEVTSASSPDDSAFEATLPKIVPVGHTQARAGEVSDGRIVYAVGQDAVFGLDAVTGRPKWRSPVGLDTPFVPIEVSASVPALLAFDGTRNELVLLNREDGAPLWRASTGARATGPPLIAQGQIDLATEDGQLKRFDIESGRPLSAVAFPQNVVGPPVLSGERLIVFGERATAYTLDFRSLAIQSVSFVGHADGALDAPPQALGRLVMSFENDRQDSALVRAFTIDEEPGTLKAAASERVDGHIHEPAVARGNVLFVPSSMERIAVFSMSDDAGQPPMTRLAGVQIPDAKDVPTFLVPGPDGMLWAAGSALRKLRLAAGKLELMQGELAPGRHTQPPQLSGESLFVARALPSAPAVYVSQADREAMTGSWRTVIGAGVAGIAASDVELTLVTTAGQSLVVAERDLASGGFSDTRILPQWDENAQQPLFGTTSGAEGLVWRDGSPVLSWRLRGGETPGAPRALSAMPQCSPVRLSGGWVLPLPGRLEWLADSVGSKVDAFLLPVGGEGSDSSRWQSLVKLDDERLIAADERGTLRLIHLRQEPLPHLGEGASVTLEVPLKRPPAAIGDRVAVAEGNVLRLLDPAGLRSVAEAKLESPITGGPWTHDSTVFVETNFRRLFAFDVAALDAKWNVDVEAPVADAPLSAEARWFVGTQTGRLIGLSEGGEEQQRFEMLTPLSHGLSMGRYVVAMGLDGALYPLPKEAASGEADGTASPPEATQ